MKLLSTSAFLLISTFCLAQTTIKGKVLDGDNQPIFFGNVVLYDLADSSIVKAATTDDFGFYELENIEDGEYYIRVTMLGFVDTFSEKVDVPGTANLDFVLLADDKVLDEVVIKGKKPLLEQKADRMVVNVENNLTTLNTNLLDVMKRVPGMIVVNEKLSMAGQSNLTILINGKNTRYMDIQSLLRDMPADNIKSIEVIHQPGAEFEASGSGPILNIILKKNSLFGTNGSVRAGIGKNFGTFYNSGLNLSHYQGSVNMQGSVSYTQNSFVERLGIVRLIQDEVFTQQNEDPSDPRAIRADGSIDWDITDKHRFGVSSRYVDSYLDKVSTNVTSVVSPSLGNFDITTANTGVREWNLFAINPYYTWEIDTAGQKLDLDYNRIQYNVDSRNELVNASGINQFGSDQLFVQPGQTSITAMRLDYVKPINNNFTVRLGGKYSTADLDNDLQVSFGENGDFVLSPEASNRFLFNEDITAAYSKLNWKLGNWSGTAGLRYEKSVSIGESIGIDTTLSRTIEKVFPSASLTRKIAGPLAANIAYSYRIERPNYSTLNPFVFNYDPLTSDRGNPNLRPELTHSTKFSLSYEGQPFFNVEYKRTNDAMVELTEQNDVTRETSRLTVNLEKFENINISLFAPLDMFTPFGGYTGVILNNNSYFSPYLDEVFDKSKWSVTTFIQMNFNLPLDIQAEAGGWLNTGDQEGIIEGFWLYGVSAGISKKFLNDQLKLSFGVDDIFNRFYKGRIEYANMDADIDVSWYTPNLSFRASYNFGNRYIKNKSKRRGAAAKEESRVEK